MFDYYYHIIHTVQRVLNLHRLTTMNAYFSCTIFFDENMPIYDLYHADNMRDREGARARTNGCLIGFFLEIMRLYFRAVSNYLFPTFIAILSRKIDRYFCFSYIIYQNATSLSFTHSLSLSLSSCSIFIMRSSKLCTCLFIWEIFLRRFYFTNTYQ